MTVKSIIKQTQCSCCGTYKARSESTVPEIRKAFKDGYYILGSETSELWGTWYHIGGLFDVKEFDVSEETMKKHFRKELELWEHDI